MPNRPMRKEDEGAWTEAAPAACFAALADGLIGQRKTEQRLADQEKEWRKARQEHEDRRGSRGVLCRPLTDGEAVPYCVARSRKQQDSTVTHRQRGLAQSRPLRNVVRSKELMDHLKRIIDREKTKKRRKEFGHVVVNELRD